MSSLGLSKRRLPLLAGMTIFTVLAWLVLLRPNVAQAACAAPATDYGSDTITVSVPLTSTYQTWSRLMPDNSTDNSYLLEVDGGNCYVVGDGSAIPANSWTWVDYQNGNSSSAIDINLTAGLHTLKLIGNAPNLEIDRLILTGDDGCIPTGTGNNCAAPSASPFDNSILVRPSGAAYYVNSGSAYPIPNPAVRDCVAVRQGAGQWFYVPDSVIDNDYLLGGSAYCDYSQDVGLNFVEENGDPTVWLVHAGGIKQHVGGLCVVDAYTTVLKKFHVWIVPPGETAGYTIGSDFFGNPTICGQLPG